MKATSNVHYGADKPNEVIYAPDMVYVNIGLHCVEVKYEEQPSVDWIAEEVYEYTYPEYVHVQDEIIASQKSINDEQDELIAELIEGA